MVILSFQIDYVSANISSNSTNNATETEDYDDAASTVSEELKVNLFHQQNFHNPWGFVGYSNADKLEGKMKVLLHTDYVIGWYNAV